MSTFLQNTKHPETGKWETAMWIDDHFAHYHYGVKFLDGKIFDPEKIELETNDKPADQKAWGWGELDESGIWDTIEDAIPTAMVAANEAEIEMIKKATAKEAVEKVFDRIYEIAPTKLFNSWNRVDTSNFFSQLAKLERELKGEK